jgi:DNA gyrase subunit A
MLQRATSDASRPEGLAPEFGLSAQGYRLSEAQAQAILELRLQRLTGLEQDKIVGEYKEVMLRIADLLDILARPERITAIIADELRLVREQFGDERRSEIVLHTQELGIEDFITPQDMVVTLSHGGYIKAQPLADYRAQRRGGRGKQAAAIKDEDFVEHLFVANTHDYILCFSNRGRCYWLKVFEAPQGSRNSRGKPIVNLFPLEEGEKINAVLPVKEFADDKYVFMATVQGTVKKTPLSDFSNPRKAGIIAVALDEGDYLVGVELTTGQSDIVLVSDAGKAVWFDEDDVRPMGRAARGVRGMKLQDGQSVIALLVAESDQQSVLVATENGFGKRTVLADFRHSGRGTQGVKAIAESERNGAVVGAKLVGDDDEIMLITTGGVLIRTRVAEIRGMGRAAQGVTLIALDEGEKLAGLEKVIESVAEVTGETAAAAESTVDAENSSDPAVDRDVDAAGGNEGGEA